MNASPTPDWGVRQRRGLHFNFPDFRQPQPKLRKISSFVSSVYLVLEWPFILAIKPDFGRSCNLTIPRVLNGQPHSAKALPVRLEKLAACQ